MKDHHYLRLLAMTVLSFLSMYVLMYAMVNRFDDVYANVNQVYMAGLMTAPMVVIELLLMRPMYPDKRLNVVLIAVSVIALVAFWLLIRQQAAVGDKQFLRSMIPHHSSALLMCRQAPIGDPEIVALCKNIAIGQQKEIDQMNARLRELAK